MTEGHPEHEHHQDPTFYRSPRDAAAAPPEKLAYVAAFSRPADQPDAMAVVDVDPQSAGYGSGVRFTELRNLGDALRHLGWTACSSPLGPPRRPRRRHPRSPVVPRLRPPRSCAPGTQPTPQGPDSRPGV